MKKMTNKEAWAQAERIVNVDSLPDQLGKRIAMAILNAGQDVYFCTISGVKTAVIK